MRSPHLPLALICLLMMAPALGQDREAEANKPFPPHRVIGNVYFVGTEELASFLITTPEGHILINSGYETTAPLIRASVETLGFRFTDIKILLGSHAHRDHMEGDAFVKALTGVQVMAMEQDVPALRDMRPGGKAHPIDRILKDRDEVRLGGTTLTAYLTAGHTKGCTTWTLKAEEGGRSYTVAIVGSINSAGAMLIDNTDYPQIVADYQRTFNFLKTLPTDVFLAPHSDFYNMPAKYAQLATLETGGVNPFIDPQGFVDRLDESERAFLQRLEEQKAGRQ